MPYLQCFGAVLDPFAAWQLMQGMKTLGVRMERHCENALAVATFLKNHPKIAWVRYSGLPGDEYYESRADYVIRNDGDMAALRLAVLELQNKLGL